MLGLALRVTAKRVSQSEKDADAREWPHMLWFLFSLVAGPLVAYAISHWQPVKPCESAVNREACERAMRE